MSQAYETVQIKPPDDPDAVQSLRLANGAWVNVYPDGEIKVAKYHAEVTVNWVTNHSEKGKSPAEGQVRLRFTDLKSAPGLD